MMIMTDTTMIYNDNDDHNDDFTQIQNGLIARSSCVGQ